MEIAAEHLERYLGGDDDYDGYEEGRYWSDRSRFAVKAEDVFEDLDSTTEE